MMPRHDEQPASCNVIPFPTPCRSVMFPKTPVIQQQPERLDAALVEHDGQVYELGTLIKLLPADHRVTLADDGPRSAQDAWDIVNRRWPALADRIVSGVVAVRTTA